MLVGGAQHPLGKAERVHSEIEQHAAPQRGGIEQPARRVEWLLAILPDWAICMLYVASDPAREEPTSSM